MAINVNPVHPKAINQLPSCFHHAVHRPSNPVVVAVVVAVVEVVVEVKEAGRGA